MIRSVLVPLDGSAFGEQALPYAFSVARRANARVELMHVHTPLAETYAEMQIYNTTLGEQMREQARRYLTNRAHELAAQTQLEVSAAFQEGQVAGRISDHVDEHKFDLVVLTTHARGALGRFWLGSVADTLIREVQVPLLLVPPAEKSLPRTALPVFKHILVPLDGTPLAEEIMPAATDLGQLFGASYTLLRAVEPLAELEPAPLGTLGNFAKLAQAEAAQVERIHEQLCQQARDYLNQFATPLRKESIEVQTQLATEYQPARAILDHPGVDLIAMATHGRRGLSRFFRGSVAEKVLRRSTLPLLVQRPRKLDAKLLPGPAQ